MSVKLKVCADCGQKKMVGRSKTRCKSCRVADPDKFRDRPPFSRRKPSKP